jgi:hypothetical protein
MAKKSEVFQVEVEMPQALFLERELVLQQRVFAAVLVHLREGLRLGAARGPVQHIAHLGAVVPVAAVAGALPVAQVLRHVQHAAVVRGHEPAAGGLAGDVVVLAQVEAEVRHRERVEHDGRLLLRGLVVLVFRQCCCCGGDGFVRVGVDAALPELLLDAAVPEVLDLVVRPPRQVRRDLRPPA